ncbi:hypothetical protein DMN91_002960 [Ooceraea biroi]|uniref:Vesicle transport v-SNARE N-terminal domain-containing protein n=1 Tax=Ooceraea biroi TaxID=2015173 RepID=A0A3L8DY47_OOCBI|nr:vesicle transport through interaction with t-SNAREs homolog 1A isoform X1 [Ooceraea biroi]RLU24869.1 hypothetical protein DMN91_002960 [Ooceraea biroi]
MASLIDNYEQQYAVLTADITAKIGRIRIQSGGEKRAFIQDVDRQIEEAQELLEQMELEVRGMNGTARDRLRGRVESHRAELKRLTQEFQTAKQPREDTMEITVEESWDNNVTEDQRKRLLDSSERIERTGRTLQNGYRMALETEEIGSHVLKELHEQRETIQRSRGRVSCELCKYFEDANYAGEKNARKCEFIMYSTLFLLFSYEKPMQNWDGDLDCCRECFFGAFNRELF